MYLSSTVDTFLRALRPAFSREATFRLFYLVVFALTVMLEPAFVTGIVRVFNLSGELAYHRLLHLFRSHGIRHDRLAVRILEYLLDNAPVKRVQERVVYAVDSIKAQKEGRRMPGVKLQHQESDDNSKRPYAFTHLFGALSVLCEKGCARCAVLIRMCLHDGLRVFERPDDEPSQVDKMASLIVNLVPAPAYILADAFYCATDFLRLLLHHQHHVITRLRMSAVAYQKAGPRERRAPGRPPLYGDKVILAEVFADTDRFNEATLDINGKSTAIRYYSQVLFWHGMEIRVVFSELKATGARALYLCTDLSLPPITVVELYASRFGIEHTFKHLVHTIGAFAYRFWTKVLPKTQRKENALYLFDFDAPTRQKLLDTVQAYHTFVAASCAALTALQLLALNRSDEVHEGCTLFFRTRPQRAAPPSVLMARYALQLELARISGGSRPPLLLWEILDELKSPEPASHPVQVFAASG